MPELEALIGLEATEVKKLHRWEEAISELQLQRVTRVDLTNIQITQHSTVKSNFYKNGKEKIILENIWVFSDVRDCPFNPYLVLRNAAIHSAGKFCWSLSGDPSFYIDDPQEYLSSFWRIKEEDWCGDAGNTPPINCLGWHHVVVLCLKVRHAHSQALVWAVHCKILREKWPAGWGWPAVTLPHRRTESWDFCRTWQVVGLVLPVGGQGGSAVRGWRGGRRGRSGGGSSSPTRSSPAPTCRSPWGMTARRSAQT